ncbi:MAG: flagellar basal body rod protein FlgB [Proteobacteria bacterium]|nr:flagellar basal body rod protein FlgB [Pseudomonadota bacterium]
MDLTKLPLFAKIAQRMNWLGERQKVLSENIANADTPNFAARDLKPQKFENLLNEKSGRVQPVATNPQHLVAAGKAASTAALERGKSTETTVAGNGVSLETEIMKMSETAMDYQLISNLYRKQLGLFRTVIGRGGSG